MLTIGLSDWNIAMVRVDSLLSFRDPTSSDYRDDQQDEEDEK